MWTLRFCLGLAALVRVDFALADTERCETPVLDRTTEGVAVSFTHEGDRLTLTFRRQETVIGERVLDVRGVDCNAMAATARLMVELTLEDLAFAEEARASVVAAESSETLPELTITVPAAEPERHEVARAPLRSIAEPPTFRLGTTADVGIGVALAGSASVVGSAVLDAAFAPASTSVVPEISGRTGLFASLPSRSQIDERDVWLSIMASRWDVCGGMRGASFRARACAGTIAGSMMAEGADGGPLVTIGARLEAAWQATNRTALLIAAEAVSIQLPTEINVIVEEWAYPVTKDISPLSLMFSTGVTGDWLSL